jgi:flagellar biosynthesis/type III secretory pathway protein FliH
VREEVERQQYVLGMMEDGFQEGYKMELQDGWSKGFDEGLEESRRRQIAASGGQGE